MSNDFAIQVDGGSATADTNAVTGNVTPITFTPGYLLKGTGQGNPSASVLYDDGANIGVGTTSPSSKLDVAGTINTSAQLRFSASSIGTATDYFTGRYLTNMVFNVPTGSGYVWARNNGDTMTLDASGNLGVGITPSAWSGLGGNGVYQLWGGALITPPGGGRDTLGLVANAFYNGTNWIYTATANATRYDMFSGEHRWYNATSGTAGATATFTQRMTLDASGNLGVGVAPVSGIRVYVRTPLTSTAYYADNGANSGFAVKFDSGITSIGQDFNAPLAFLTNNTEKMRLDASGNLGIGVTPQAFSSGYRAINLGHRYASIATQVGNAVDFNLSWNAVSTGVDTWAYVGTGDVARQLQIDTGGFKFRTAGSGTAGAAITWTQAMTLDGNGNLSIGGNVGIGTTTPGAQLQVGGTSSATPQKILIRSTTVDTYMQSTSAGSEFGTPNNQPVLIKTNDAERVRVDAAGYTQFVGNLAMPYQPTPTSKAAAATLTGAELVTGILQYTGAAATVTLPTGANIEAALTWAGNNVSLDWFVINTGSGTCTIGANGNTTVGLLTVALGNSGHFRIRRTAASTFTVYRLA